MGHRKGARLILGLCLCGILCCITGAGGLGCFVFGQLVLPRSLIRPVMFFEERRGTFMRHSRLVVDICRMLMRGRPPAPVTFMLGLAHLSSVSQSRNSPGTGVCPGAAARPGWRERGAVGMSVIDG